MAAVKEAAEKVAALATSAAEERKAPSRPQKASCDLSQLQSPRTSR